MEVLTSISARSTDVDSNELIKSRRLAVMKLLPTGYENMQQKMDKRFKDDNFIDFSILFCLSKCCQYFYNENYELCRNSSQQLIDICWEKLNSYHWKDVPIAWQEMYSYGCLFKSVSKACMIKDIDDFQAICHTCDMGLLMGQNILDGVLHSVIEIYRPLSTLPKILEQGKDILIAPKIRKAIPTLQKPSLETFRHTCMEANAPVILDGCTEHWPASKLWCFQYLNTVAGHRLVPVELGLKYTDDSWGQKLITISDFISNYIINADNNSPKAYLAQHQLFNQIPSLKDDIYVPDYCCISKFENWDPDSDTEINAWFGPAGTVSPCHYDFKHNLLVQVVGRKYVRLYPQTCSAALYPHEGLLKNTSQIDVENPDAKKYPEFLAMDENSRIECMLMPGQMLYIPPLCWHYIRSLDESFSVSFWWE